MLSMDQFLLVLRFAGILTGLFFADTVILVQKIIAICKMAQVILGRRGREIDDRQVRAEHADVWIRAGKLLKDCDGLSKQTSCDGGVRERPLIPGQVSAASTKFGQPPKELGLGRVLIKKSFQNLDP